MERKTGGNFASDLRSIAFFLALFLFESFISIIIIFIHGVFAYPDRYVPVILQVAGV